MNFLKKKKILVIVTGGISCYKTLDLIRRLQEMEVDIECILTQNTQEFVKPITFESLLGKKIHLNLFSLDQERNMNHIKLANSCDAIIVVPCTANFISKLSNGSADDLATNVLLASKKIKIIAPAMNTNMWQNKAVRNNLKNLSKMGIKVLNPEIGKLACKTKGVGKLMEVNTIVYELNLLFSERFLHGKKAIITAGPSIEKIDPVRFISNFSSGIQGYEIAKILSYYGAKTLLISGPTNLQPPPNVDLISVNSGDQFLKESIKNLPADIYISVAAISDWKSNKINSRKIKKKKNTHSVDLILNPDVLNNISVHKKRPRLVIGFSAETTNLKTNSKKKFFQKKCDWMLANLISKKSGFDNTKNKIFFISKEIEEEWPLASKKIIATKLVKKIVSFFKKNKLIKV